jgi:Mg-chelatase subunit ChlD
MSKRSSLLLVVSFLVSALPYAWADDPAASPSATGRLATFDTSSGETYFALSLAPQAASVTAEARDVVVLFDTSASQTGKYRTDALEALRTLLAQLGETDRVKLVAVDLNATAMTSDFVAPRGAEMDAAIAKLEKRTPLGSTDLLSGLRSAADGFAAGSTRPCAVLYLGDGMSRAKLVEPQEFSGLMQDLVDRHVPVSSWAVGPNRDPLVLAAIANRTGGALFIDTDENTAQQAGAALAQSVRATVYWPVDTKMSSGLAEVYPRSLPPLRSDRDTILVGMLKDRQPQEITAATEVNGKQVSATWKIAPEAASPDFNFLPQLVELARRDDGATLPTPGSLALQGIARSITNSADGLVALGGQALNSGDVAGARTAAQEAIARDPGNPQAVALNNVASEPRTGRSSSLRRQ